MTYSLVGQSLDQIQEAPESSISIDENNVATARVKFTGEWPEALNRALQVDRHPDFNELTRRDIDVNRTDPCLAEVTITFEGVVNESENEPNVRTRYALRGTTQTSPIQAHPKFGGPDGFGGEPIKGTKFTNPETGATFDENGKFIGFAVEGKDDNFYPDENRNKAGIRQYLDPRIVYTERASYNALAVQTIAVNMNNLGNIDEPPDSKILPEVRAPRDWLLTGASVEEVGEGVKFNRDWMLSGRRGWDKDIYKDDD